MEASDDSARQRARLESEPQPLFLCDGGWQRAARLASDLCQFITVLLLYLLLIAVGLPALGLDRLLGTRYFDAFLAVIEWLDEL